MTEWIYYPYLKLIELNARQGRSLLNNTSKENPCKEQGTIPDAVELPLSISTNQRTNAPVPPRVTDTSVSQPSLIFKQRIKSRGRPKRKEKQLTFNRTDKDNKSTHSHPSCSSSTTTTSELAAKKRGRGQNKQPERRDG